MKKFFVLVKKEIRELLTIQMILPLVMMTVIFSFLGNIISQETKKMSAPQPLWLMDADQSAASQKVCDLLGKSNFKLTVFPSDKNIEELIGEAKEKNISSLLVIPDGFEKNVNNFKPEQIGVYKVINNFSLISSISLSNADRAVKIASDYVSNDWISKNRIAIAPETLKNPVQANEFVVVGSRRANVPVSLISSFIQQQTTFVPIILFMVIIMAAQMVAMTVANEKENKTLETLLTLPVNRKTIVFAKLVGAGLVAILSCLVYMFGFKNYMEGITGGAATAGATDVAAKALADLGITFGVFEYTLLGTSLFLSILVALAIALILGTLAENVKNVQATVTPLMVLVMIPYFLVLFLDMNTMPSWIRYLIYVIPFAHPFLAMQKIILHDYWFIGLGIFYQFLVFVAFVVLAAHIFSSDKIITLKLNFGRKQKG